MLDPVELETGECKHEHEHKGEPKGTQGRPAKHCEIEVSAGFSRVPTPNFKVSQAEALPARQFSLQVAEYP